MNDLTFRCDEASVVMPPMPSMPQLPLHDAVQLTGGGNLAQIALAGQVYTLRITRAGKLILTK